MNPWPVYSFIKKQFFATGRFPTNREISSAVPGATFEEIREGRIEAEIQYNREWRHYKTDASTNSREVEGSA